MGNYPSEYYGVKCKCGKDLPPCKEFSHFKEENVDRIVDTVRVYNFLGGQYYRLTNCPKIYYCPECFWRPMHEEKERLEEIERKKERARKRKAKLELRKQEAEEEAMRQEALRKKEEKRKEERRKLEQAKKKRQAQFEYELAEEKSISQSFLTWTLNNDAKRIRETVQIESYKPFKFTTEIQPSIQDAVNPYYINESLTDDSDEMSSDEEIGEINVVSTEISKSNIVSTEMVSTVLSIISNMQPNEELDTKWLMAAQTLLLTYISQMCHFSQLEAEILFDHLIDFQSGLSNDESLYLTKTLRSIAMEDAHSTSDYLLKKGLPLACQFSILLLFYGSSELHNSSQWMRKCLSISISTMTQDMQLQKMILEAVNEFWSGYDWLHFLHSCRLSASSQKYILHLIQTYQIKPKCIESVLNSKVHVIDSLEAEIKKQKKEDKLLTDIMKEIKKTKLVDEVTLGQVRSIIMTINQLIDENDIDIELDFNVYLSYDKKSFTKKVFKQLLNKGLNTHERNIASAIITLMCAVQKVKGFYPRETQLVAFVILLLSSKQSVNRLLQVLTGEGKSCVVAMFAAFLAIQGKHVDIITSSPILALRDAEEWIEFYDEFGLGVAHNTDLKQDSPDNPDKEKRICYRNPIVYGTISNFSADVLREEFEQKHIRSGRRFDAVIVDEVDLLMLDEGVQFTYLSHNAAVLHHIEPVLATVWAVIGPFRVAPTVDGNILFAGTPKLFTEAIFECLNLAECSGVQDSSQLLVIARDSDLIDDKQFQKLNSTDLQEKIDAMSEIQIEDAIALLAELENYISGLRNYFQIYVVNEELGLLEQVVHQADNEEAKILLLDNGKACLLNTQKELREGGTIKVKDSLHFSDEGKRTGVSLPCFIKDFAMNQVPTYVDNAIRALQMAENREYAVSEDGKIIPVDFMNSGVMELNKKWGGGLQQMLEMKHNLSISSVSLVTNFMSNIEFFLRYRSEGNIYGLSGTLGLDSVVTSEILCSLYEVHVCSIPTHKLRKIYEMPAIIVNGDEKIWLEEITNSINKAVSKEEWKKGRSVLVLCEDIKTAEMLKKYLLEVEKWKADKIHLYAHSNSKELGSIKQELQSGEIVIATNLAGRGTDIKVCDEVNKSGGLLCLLTFLPRNRRVELQAFGRTGREGKPGSVQCILKASSLPPHYQGLDIKVIRNLREEEEALRLNTLINSDVKEVNLKEKLFKQYCKFLQDVNHQFGKRDDISVIVSSLNENWGQWLQMRSEQIEQLKEAELVRSLSRVQGKWQPVPGATPHFIHLPVTNFYHLTKFGNKLLIKQDKENADKACEYYSESIHMEPMYALIACYNRAYCTIVSEKSGYKERAIRDLESALNCIDPYVQEVMSTLHCVSIVSQVRETAAKQLGPDQEAEEGAKDLTSQMQARLQILGFIREKIEETIKLIKQIGKSDIKSTPVGIFSLIPNANNITSKEIALMWTLGFEVIFSVEKKPKFCWSGLICFFLGVAQIAAGVFLTVCSVGTAASIGMGLIGEGISDCISGIEGMVKGEFSWTDYAVNKAAGLAISLVSGGIGRLASTGTKVFKAGYKVGKEVSQRSFGAAAKSNLKYASKYVAKEGRELKAIPKIVGNSFGQAGRTNIKNAAKYVAKECATQGLSYAHNKFFEDLLEKVAKYLGNKCKENIMTELKLNFVKRDLGEIVDRQFIDKLDRSFIANDEMSPLMKKQAEDFFTKVCDVAVHKLVTHSEVEERLTSASLQLFTQISQKSRKGGKIDFAAKFAEMTVIYSVADKAIDKLDTLIDRFICETRSVCLKFMEQQKTVVYFQEESRYSHLKCAAGLKSSLASQVGKTFGNAVATLLQQNLGSLVNHGASRSVGRVGTKILGKYVLQTNKTLEDIKAGQHANYIRSVEATLSSHGNAKKSMTNQYAKHVAGSNNPGSLMDLRIAVEHYGQGVTIYQEKNGKLVKGSSIGPSKKKEGNIELVFTPPTNHQSVGHYDVLINGKRVKVEADKSNCLFHAFACGQNPGLSHGELKLQAEKVRKNVAKCIEEQPHMWNDHIKCRMEMVKLRRGNRFAMIGAGPGNPETKIIKGLYRQEKVGAELFTMYEQANGVVCKAVQTFNKPIILKDGIVAGDSTRLTHVMVHMDGLNLKENKGKRCWATEPITGMLKRHEGKSKDSEVSFHLCPSRGGANAGNAYANAVMASTQYNTLEKAIWSDAVSKCIGDGKFSMKVEGKMGSVVPPVQEQSHFFKTLGKARKEEIDPKTQQKLLKRFELIESQEKRAHRVKELKFTLQLPTATREQLDAIKNSNQKPPVEIDHNKKTATFKMPMDCDLFVPKQLKLDKNGEQSPGEITNALSKKENQRVGREPEYKYAPSQPTDKKKKQFDNSFEEFVMSMNPSTAYNPSYGSTTSSKERNPPITAVARHELTAPTQRVQNTVGEKKRQKLS